MKNPEQVIFVLVDDDDIDVIGLKRAISHCKLKNPVVRARDGLEALKILRDISNLSNPYILIVDINLPKMNGLDLIRNIREDLTTKNSIIFILSTSAASEDKCRAYEHHVAGYMIKSKVCNDYVKVIRLIEQYCAINELPVHN